MLLSKYEFFQVTCKLRGINVFDDLKFPLAQCENKDEKSIFLKITENSLAPPNCEHCLPPCNSKKYEFKVYISYNSLGIKIKIDNPSSLTRKLKVGLEQTKQF